jgi:hypothetical protein
LDFGKYATTTIIWIWNGWLVFGFCKTYATFIGFKLNEVCILIIDIYYVIFIVRVAKIVPATLPLPRRVNFWVVRAATLFRFHNLVLNIARWSISVLVNLYIKTKPKIMHTAIIIYNSTLVHKLVCNHKLIKSNINRSNLRWYD